MVLDNDILRSIVIECLRKDRPQFRSDPAFSVNILFREVAELARAKGLEVRPGTNAWLMNHDVPELHGNLRTPIWTIVWDLIIEGVLRPGAENGEPSLPYIRVTDHGKRAITGMVTPYDPSGYLQELKTRIPTLDPVIEKYIAEAGETLRRNCLLSSTVTLGCASEKALLLLSDSYRNALSSTSQTAYDVVVSDTRGIKQHHQAFMVEYQKLRPKLKSDKSTDWLTGMDHALDHIFSYFREMRNSAGHPSGFAFTKELASSHLTLFPYYLRLMYDLIEWCDANKPL